MAAIETLELNLIFFTAKASGMNAILVLAAIVTLFLGYRLTVILLNRRPKKRG